jgi:hypothetical protein
VVAEPIKEAVMSSNPGPNGYQSAFAPGSQNHDRRSEGEEGEVGKALVVGLLGGLLSAAGYLVYRRLPDEQRDKINGQVRSMLQQRITEIRENLNI